MKLFVDLDGVLCDFEGNYLKKFGVNFGLDNKTTRWKNLDDVSFWADMPWTRDGQDLWFILRLATPSILTAPTQEESSRIGKKKWCKKNLGGDVPVILETDKAKYAEHNAILIDDRQSNIEAWQRAGGVGIQHTSFASTIHALRQLFTDSIPSYSQMIQQHYEKR